MNRAFKILFLLLVVITFNTQIAEASTISNAKIVYNTKPFEFGEIGVVAQDDSIYIPLRVFSEQLGYTVDWNSEEKFVRIYDNLNEVYLYTSGRVKVNGIESTSDKIPLLIQSNLYVPLRFVSESLRVKVEWRSNENKVYMSGPTIYEISSSNNLIAYTSSGKKIVSQLYSSDNNKPIIELVNRTQYSDIVTTTMESSGAITSTITHQMYIRNSALVYSTEEKSEVKNMYTGKNYGLKYYDNKVAFLTRSTEGDYLIKIFDDTTGALSKTINTTKEYGEVRNIQAVGDGFIVVNMAQSNKLSPVPDPGSYYMTTVIDLNTKKTSSIYEKVNNPLSYIAIASNSAMYMLSGSIVTDGIYFSGKTKNELTFNCFPSSNEKNTYVHTLK